MSAVAPPQRREYLDWLRGVAVLLMISAHLFDSWTRAADRDTLLFRGVMLVGGMGTTLFLFLAGMSLTLSAGSKLRRTGSQQAASLAVMRRGFEIFLLAFVFRFQAWLLGWSRNAWDLLKVDILNIMGPAIIAGAVLWRCGRTSTSRFAILLGSAVLVGIATPPVRTFANAILPRPLQAYITPVEGLSNFVFFPWLALVFAGAAVGVVVERTLPGVAERLTIRRIGVGGIVVGLLAFGASFLPSPFGASEFWTTSPSYLFIRAALGTLAVAIAYWSMAAAPGRWQLLVLLGRSSLFVYWIHVEMLYGLVSRPWHGQLSATAAAAAYVPFCALIVACVLMKNAAGGGWRRSRGQATAVDAAVS